MFSQVIKLASWNVRGLRSHNRQSYVRNFVRKESLDVLMLQEAKLGEEPLNIRRYDYITSIATRDTCGRMQQIRNKFKARYIYKNSLGRLIKCQITIDNVQLGLVCIYAPNIENKRRVL